MSEKKIDLKKDKTLIKNILNELNKVVVGHPEVIKASVRSLITGGHLLIDGIPGSAKTLLAKSLAKVTGVNPVRIQGRPFLEAKDVFGEKVNNRFVKGPLFHEFIIVDHINRIEPENQAMLLEAMEERQISIGAKKYNLEEDFILIGTMTSLDGGVFPLVGTLLDRFMFCVNMDNPNMHDEHIILHNHEEWTPKTASLKVLLNKTKLANLKKDVRKVYMNTEVHKYILRIVQATRNPKKFHVPNSQCVLLGCSSRGAIALMMAAKADALIEGDDFVTPQNVKNVAHDVLRHRIILSEESLEKEITPDLIIREILKRVPVL